MILVDVIVYFIAGMITLPMIVTLIMYWGALNFSFHKLKALHFAVHWSCLLYIIADLILIRIIFNQQVVGIVLLCFLCLFTIIVINQCKVKNEVNFSKGIKLVWRMSFLFFLMMYICLFFIGVSQGMFCD